MLMKINGCVSAIATISLTNVLLGYRQLYVELRDKLYQVLETENAYSQDQFFHKQHNGGTKNPTDVSQPP